ncbi:hypothetical protein [Thalassotalea marina]|uniref:Uncharacterized protein n=1 Tax=Thalassotalea marina TaxID=1673741 RepID=A0A919BLT4_9GAMM|nr:hypothetical protein [Thalassotalea marina]GHG00258.1 hypothetical protein GCM10017161_31130 [Thalassotalea marina]
MESNAAPDINKKLLIENAIKDHEVKYWLKQYLKVLIRAQAEYWNLWVNLK